MHGPTARTLAKDTRQAHLYPDEFILPRSAHILATRFAGGGTLMRLTSFFDYTLRLLMYAATHSDRLITIEEAAGVYGI
jgi:hypothetical protein